MPILTKTKSKRLVETFFFDEALVSSRRERRGSVLLGLRRASARHGAGLSGLCRSSRLSSLVGDRSRPILAL